MFSLVQSLEKIDKKPPFSILKDLQTYPSSLREIMRIMNLPNPKIKILQRKKIYEFSENNAQGLVYGFGNIWYLSSEKRIFKMTINGENIYENPTFIKEKSVYIGELLSDINIDDKKFDHIGDIDYCDGIIFANLRYKENKKNPLLLALSKNLDVIGYSRLPMDVKDAWCAINPWNKMLYVEKDSNNGPTILAVYDLSKLVKLKNQPRLWGRRGSVKFKKTYSFLRAGIPEEVPSIQGITFSPNGRIYVARYRVAARLNGDPIDWKNYMRVYSALTGERLDTSEEIDFPGTGDEIEGISIHPSGVLYIAVADNDNQIPEWLGGGGKDEFEIYAFKYPDNTYQI